MPGATRRPSTWRTMCRFLCYRGPALALETLLYEPTGYSLKEPLVRRYSAVEWDCLILDYVVLHPRWRGLRLGLLAARKAVDVK